MEKYSIDKTAKSPAIELDLTSGKLEIKGCSTPENSTEFYRPLMEALEKYSEAPKTATEVVVYLDYFNTSSSKCLFMVFKKLESIKKEGHPVTINWHYEEGDEDMLEAGEDYQSIIDVPFKMVEVKV
jgi:hypothetical protein